MNDRVEPTLAELLADPIIVTLMHRDGTSGEHVLAMMDRVRRNLRALRREQRLAA